MVLVPENGPDHGTLANLFQMILGSFIITH